MTTDPRQELFCRLVANGATPATAARMAGYANPASGETLLAAPGMGEQVAALAAQRETGHAAMFDRLEAWLIQLVDRSIELGQIGNALRAIDRLMQLHGMNGKGNGRLPAIESLAKPAPAPILDDLSTMLSPFAAEEPALNRRERRALQSALRRK